MGTRFNFLASIFVLSTLAACGGGGSATPSTQADNALVSVANTGTVSLSPELASEAIGTFPAAASMPPVAAAVSRKKWCWSMQSGQLRGTFLSVEKVNGARGTGAQIYFIPSQQEAWTSRSGGHLLFRESTPIAFAPANASGQCAGEV